MPKAITTDPKRCSGLPTLTGTRILVSDVLAYLANRSGLAETVKTTNWPQAGVVAMLYELAEHYSHPPAPSPSIEVAAKEIVDRLSRDIELDEPVAEQVIADILTRHFGQAVEPAELELHNQLLRDRLDAIRPFVAGDTEALATEKGQDDES